MAVKSLYTDELWKRYCDKVIDSKEEFTIKKYPQLDPFFDFQKESDKIKTLVSDQTLNSIANHSLINFNFIFTSFFQGIQKKFNIICTKFR